MNDFACCVSSVGPRCGHAIGGQGVTLERAARESLEIALVNGTRPGDPLAALVTSETWRDWIEVAELVTGRSIDRTGPGDMAARVRAAMGRHVVKHSS